MQNKKINVKKNYILNIIANIISILVPLLTTPYISRALGANSIGIYSYCLSIETYFVILGTLGIPLYAKREIASIQNKRNSLNKIFSELLSLQIFTMAASIVIYIISTIIIRNNYNMMFMACGIGIVAASFDVSWLFIGIEDFATIVKRSIAFKIISIALIFLLVKEQSDLYIYAFSIMLANLACNVWLLISSKRVVTFIKPEFKNIRKHIKPAIILLLPTIITSIYAVIDKSMLGAITNNMSEVGIYEQSQKIINICLLVVTSLGAVLMPRLSALYSTNDHKQLKKYINKGLSITMLISIPLAFGCAIISNILVPWFYGDGFEKITELLKIFAPIYIFMGISDLIGTQLLIATKKEKQLLKINLASIIINLMINLLLIPKLLSYGAAIATLIAEAIKTILFIKASKEYINNREVIKSFIKYMSLSVIMSIILLFIMNNIDKQPTILNTIFIAAIGVITYAFMLIITKDKIILQLIRAIKTQKEKR